MNFEPEFMPLTTKCFPNGGNVFSQPKPLKKFCKRKCKWVFDPNSLDGLFLHQKWGSNPCNALVLEALVRHFS